MRGKGFWAGRGSRGTVEVALAIVLGVLAVGTLLGAGLADQALGTEDQLTWLASMDGQITRINPETGRLVDRVQIGPRGSELTVTQGDGKLIVMNPADGRVTLVDLSQLTIGGVRNGNAGATKVLLTGGRVYLVDRAAGTVEHLDAYTGATVGRPWRSSVPLADGGGSGDGLVWVLGIGGELVALQWSDRAAGFVEQSRRTVPVGDQSVLVTHEHGVTTLDPRSGTVARVGTGHDVTLKAPVVRAPLEAPDMTPAELVVASAPAESKLIIAGEETVMTVDGNALGCARLGRPVVYHDRVYAPCPNDRKVVVLDRSGRRAASDIATPAGKPVLVLNAGLLIVNVLGADMGMVILPDGSIRTIRTNDPAVPVHQPGATPRPLPTARTQPTRQGDGPGRQPTSGPAGGGRGGGSGGTSTGRPTTTTPPAPTTPGAVLYTPTGVTAEARPDSTILVSWQPGPQRPASYRIVRSDTATAVVSDIPAGATSGIVSSFPRGQTVTFVVVAVTPARDYPSAPSNPVSAYGQPAGPNVSVQLSARTPNSVTLTVTVDVVSDGGRPVTTYDLSVSSTSGRPIGSARNVPIGQRPYQVTTTCSGFFDICLSGGDVVATATLSNAAGAGPPNSGGANIAAPPVFNVYENVPVMMVSAGGKCLDRDLRLHTCTGGVSQMWTPRDLGDILSSVDRACLDHHRRTSLTVSPQSDSDCRNRDDPMRWVHIPNTPVNSLRAFRGEGLNRCIAIIGDPAGEGTQVDLRDCNGTDSQRWFLYKQTSGVPLAAGFTGAPAASSTADGGLGAAVAVLFAVPAVVGSLRSRRRRSASVRSGR